MSNKWPVAQTDNDFNLAANWNGATLPVAADDVYFDGPFVFTKNVDAATHGITHLNIHVSRGFRGRVGTPAAPLEMANNAHKSTIIFNGPYCAGFYFSGNCSNVWIVDTYSSVGSFSIVGGTVDMTRCLGGKGALLAAAGTFTAVQISRQDTYVEIEDGNTISHLYSVNGVVKCATQVTSVHQGDGECWLTGSGKTFASIIVRGQNGKLYLECPSSTITTLHPFTGRVWGLGTAESRVITITNLLKVEADAIVNLGPHFTMSNNVENHGGTYNGPGTVNNKVPGISPPIPPA